MNNHQKVLGIDVSKDNITCHILKEYPVGGVSNYWNSTRLKESKLYPKFYNRKKKGCKDVWDFVDYLRKESPTFALLEPTGVHYSKLWAQVLESLGVKVLWVGHIELKRFRGGLNLKGHTKNDAVDALALAAYYLNPEYRLLNGESDPSKFLKPQPQSILKLRELVNYQEHLLKIQSPVI